MGETVSSREPSDSGTQFGKYRIVRKIGEGAFGTVYEAWLPGAMGFRKRVAIKRLRPEKVRKDERFVQSMVNEARIGALLQHPNIVYTIEFDRIDDAYYLAMEYVDGATLEQLQRLCRRRRVLLPRFAIVDLVGQVCRGLTCAHELEDRRGEPLGLVHRDLKPSNIIVTRSGTAKILDFGIAKSRSNLFDDTTTGLTKGTPRFMSPEQLRGERPLLPRSDIFSLGVLLYELITDRPMFEADSIGELVTQILNTPLGDRIAEAEASFPGSGPILERCLERDAEARYQDALSLATDLKQLGRRFPAAANMAGVMARLLPAMDQTDAGSLPPRDPEDSTHDSVLDLSTLEAVSFDPTPLPFLGPDSSGWQQFTNAFDIARASDPSSGEEAGPDSPDHALAWAETEGELLPRPRWLGWPLVAVLALIASVLGITAVALGPTPGPASQPEATAAVNAGKGTNTPDVGSVGVPIRTSRRVDQPAEAPQESAPPSPTATPTPTPIPTATAKSVRSVATRTPTPSATPASTPAAEPEMGTIQVSWQPWGRVYLDGMLIKSESMGLRDYELPRGPHVLRVECGEFSAQKAWPFNVGAEKLWLGCWDFHLAGPCVEEAP